MSVLMVHKVSLAVIQWLCRWGGGGYFADACASLKVKVAMLLKRSYVSADVFSLQKGERDLQESAYERLWRHYFHSRRVGVAVVLQVDGDERVAFVLHGALVLEAVLNVVEGRVTVAAHHALVADARHGGHRQHDVERLAHPQRLLRSVDALPLQFRADEVGQRVDAACRDDGLQPPVLNGAQQLAHGLVLPPALEVFEEDVGVEKYFHGLLQLVLVFQVVLYEFLLRCTRAEDAAECLMAVLALAFPCGLGLCDELLGVSRELPLQQVDAVRTGHIDVYVDGSCFHNSQHLEFYGAKVRISEQNSK